MDCYTVQHDGRIAKKTVEDRIKDESRTKIFKFGDLGVVQEQKFTKRFFHAVQLIQATLTHPEFEMQIVLPSSFLGNMNQVRPLFLS